MAIAALSGWTSEQKHVVAASFLGWTLDAFDFFLMVFVLTDIAKEFHTDVTQVTVAILLTLAMRPIGAFLFGRAADRWGRRPTLMVDVFQYIGWRGMFMIGVLPALLVFYIRRNVPESPSWTPTTARSNTLAVLKSHWRLGIYAILLMTAFNFFSHGTQDLYPTFLQVQHGFGPHEVGLIAVIYNIGAIIGGISFGSLSERFGRRRIIIIAAVLSLLVLPLWAFAASAVWLAVGAFLMQVMVQGAWGVVPVHLNELSPDEARGTFPGFVYQLGNLIASVNATLQAAIAAHYGGNYAFALAVVAGTVAVAIVILTALGSEAKGVVFGNARLREAEAGGAAVPRASSG